jgi:hypothetical protein
MLIMGLEMLTFHWYDMIPDTEYQQPLKVGGGEEIFN